MKRLLAAIVTTQRILHLQPLIYSLYERTGRNQKIYYQSA